MTKISWIYFEKGDPSVFLNKNFHFMKKSVFLSKYKANVL
jgi:hypothetical protein